MSPRWDLKFGPYISILTNGDFSGVAYDGYIREGDPTGTKANVTEATYDFSGDLRKFQWGLDAGAEWRAYKHLSVYADLTWGLNSIFPGDFDRNGCWRTDLYCTSIVDHRRNHCTYII